MKTITQLTFVVPMYDVAITELGEMMYMPTTCDAELYMVYEFDYDEQRFVWSEEFGDKRSAVKYANERHIELCKEHNTDVNDPASIAAGGD